MVEKSSPPNRLAVLALGIHTKVFQSLGTLCSLPPPPLRKQMTILIAELGSPEVYPIPRLLVPEMKVRSMLTSLILVCDSLLQLI